MKMRPVGMCHLPNGVSESYSELANRHNMVSPNYVVFSVPVFCIIKIHNSLFHIFIFYPTSFISSA